MLNKPGACFTFQAYLYDVLFFKRHRGSRLMSVIATHATTSLWSDSILLTGVPILQMTRRSQPGH